MRTLPAHIAAAVDPQRRPRLFTGDFQANARVTVQPDWFLTPHTTGIGAWPLDKSPIRSFQNAANDQAEIEVPNIATVTRDKSVDNAAAECTIVLFNQRMDPNDVGLRTPPTELGNPGYYWPTRGKTSEARSRWGQQTNEWKDILVQNQLVRVYEGFGGQDLTVEQAVAEGYLMLRFVGLIDSVHGGTDGKMTLKCRDMIGQLLVDQQLLWGLIPTEQYPLSYYRWVFNNTELQSGARDITSGSTITQQPGDRPCTYVDSSGDRWYGFNASIHGHRPTDALDSNPDSFWLSVGNSSADAPFATDWIEFDCGGQAVNAVYIDPLFGNCWLYVSVLENGVWQGGDIIPYDPSILFATQSPAVDTGAAIPYAHAAAIPAGVAQEYVLERTYAAQRVRVSFRHHTYTEWGEWHFRTGVREFRPRISANAPSTVTSVQTQHIDPLYLSAATHPDSGYVTVDSIHRVDAFGLARIEQRTSVPPDNNVSIAIRMTSSGKGYYVLAGNGRVYVYGDAVWHGDLPTSGVDVGTHICNDIAITADGGGYWLIQSTGQVYAFGNAPNLVGFVPPTGDAILIAIEAKGSTGLWTLDTHGTVHVYGSAGNFGSYSPATTGDPQLPHENCVSLRATSTGAGYWILTSEGRVQHFGDAPNVGGVASPAASDGNWRNQYWELIQVPNASDNGYLVLRGDGSIFPIGDVPPVDYFGGPSQGSVQQKADGNYLDLADIVRDLLLWSGFWLEDSLGIGDMPQVFGVIESTGTWVNDAFAADTFDKKPVVDAISIIKEIPGYILFGTDEGGVKFVSPNLWRSGNFDENEVHTDFIPEVDERIDITGLDVELPARPIRSPIIIGSSQIDPKNPNATVHVEYEPPYAGLLHGMQRPAMWIDQEFKERSEMQIMAELISVQIWFQLRVDSVDCWVNPAIELDDQVRILERQTSETEIHYVRGINDTLDNQAGKWTMRLSTNRLGDDELWAITVDHVDQSDTGLPDRFQISAELAAWLQSRSTDRSIAGYRTLGPDTVQPSPAGTQVGVGSGSGTP